MSALRLAFLVHDIDACGGMERQALLLARTLAARGHRVHVLCSRNVPRGLRALWPHSERRGPLRVSWIPLASEVPLQAAYELAFLSGAAALLGAGSPDLIYAVQVPSGPLARDLARFAGVPWVLKLAGGGATGDLAGTEGHPDAARRLEALREADAVVCLSRQIEEEVRRAGVSPERLVHVPNGVDVAALRGAQPLPATALGLEPGARPLLFVGRLDAGKRVDVLLRAVAGLKERDPTVRLLIAGRGPAEVSLQALCDQLDLRAQVRFLGQRDDVPRLLALAAALVLPSAAEGMSNALLEAMAAGRPVVATRIPANELLVDERCAWLVPVDDAPALAEALAAALGAEGPPRAAEAARRVEARFGIEVVAAAYEQLFARLLARPAPLAAAATPAGIAQRVKYLLGRTGHARAWASDQGLAGARAAITGLVLRAKRLAGRA